MVDKFVRWSAIGVTVFALWVGMALMAPEPLAAARCGGPGVRICWMTESCAVFSVYPVCTTEIAYWRDGTEPLEEPKPRRDPKMPEGPEELLADG